MSSAIRRMSENGLVDVLRMLELYGRVALVELSRLPSRPVSMLRSRSETDDVIDEEDVASDERGIDAFLLAFSFGF